MSKGIIKSIGINSRLLEKDTLENELEIKVKNYNKILLKLMQNSKANHVNSSFHENKLNLFEAWEGIR